LDLSLKIKKAEAERLKQEAQAAQEQTGTSNSEKDEAARRAQDAEAELARIREELEKARAARQTAEEAKAEALAEQERLRRAEAEAKAETEAARKAQTEAERLKQEAEKNSEELRNKNKDLVARRFVDSILLAARKSKIKKQQQELESLNQKLSTQASEREKIVSQKEQAEEEVKKIKEQFAAINRLKELLAQKRNDLTDEEKAEIEKLKGDLSSTNDAYDHDYFYGLRKEKALAEEVDRLALKLNKQLADAEAKKAQFDLELKKKDKRIKELNDEINEFKKRPQNPDPSDLNAEIARLKSEVADKAHELKVTTMLNKQLQAQSKKKPDNTVSIDYAAQDDLAGAKARLKALEIAQQKLIKDKAELDKKLLDTNQHNTNLQQKLNSVVSSSLVDKEKMKDLLKKMVADKSELERLKREGQGVSSQGNQARINELENQLKDQQVNLDKNRDYMTSQQKKIKELEAARANEDALNETIKELKKQIASAGSSSNNWSELNKKLSEALAERARLEKRINEMGNVQGQASTMTKAKNDALQRLDEARSQVESLQNTVTEQAAKLENLAQNGSIVETRDFGTRPDDNPEYPPLSEVLNPKTPEELAAEEAKKKADEAKAKKKADINQAITYLATNYPGSFTNIQKDLLEKILDGNSGLLLKNVGQGTQSKVCFVIQKDPLVNTDDPKHIENYEIVVDEDNKPILFEIPLKTNLTKLTNNIQKNGPLKILSNQVLNNGQITGGLTYSDSGGLKIPNSTLSFITLEDYKNKIARARPLTTVEHQSTGSASAPNRPGHAVSVTPPARHAVSVTPPARTAARGARVK
jgi:DNA repair exonuclease SbcCD ATPase subunit